MKGSWNILNDQNGWNACACNVTMCKMLSELSLPVEVFPGCRIQVLTDGFFVLMRTGDALSTRVGYRSFTAATGALLSIIRPLPQYDTPWAPNHGTVEMRSPLTCYLSCKHACCCSIPFQPRFIHARMHPKQWRSASFMLAVCSADMTGVYALACACGSRHAAPSSIRHAAVFGCQSTGYRSTSSAQDHPGGQVWAEPHLAAAQCRMAGRSTQICQFNMGCKSVRPPTFRRTWREH
eukprot:365325-Chlamydomonas_euryale.AAC.4